MPDNLAKLKTDRDVAEETGRIADAFQWPTLGRKPERFPFFVAARIGGYALDVDARVTEREWKTLDYFGFCNRAKTIIGGGIWCTQNDSYCRPDLARMKKRAQNRAAEFQQQGRPAENIVFCMLMDEPTRGVDVGAKREIGELLGSLADAGTSVLLVTSEIEEMVALADRVAVLRDGVIAAELQDDNITEAGLMAAAMGMERADV